MNQLELYNTFWNPGLKAWSDMERRGIRIDPQACEIAAENATIMAGEYMGELEKWRGSHPPINWNSSQQLSKFLYDYKNLPIPKVMGSRSAVKLNRQKKKSTSQASLEWLCENTEYRPELKNLLKWRAATMDATRVSKYPSFADENMRIHSVMAPTTDTGRGASKNPALQQIPSEERDEFGIRSCFVASPGHKLVVADYSQLELYVLAHYMIKWFKDDRLYQALSDGDVHSNIARLAWPHLKKYTGNLKQHGPKIAAYRSNVKSIVYGVNYGKTAQGLGVSIEDEDGNQIGTKKAQELIDVIVSATGSSLYSERVRNFSTQRGFVGTLAGRRRPIPEAQSSEKWEVARGHRKAQNTPIQGGAADIVQMAMVRLLEKPLVLQVHDELILEVPEEAAEEAEHYLVEAMTKPMFNLQVQLVADSAIVDHWGEGH